MQGGRSLQEPSKNPFREERQQMRVEIGHERPTPLPPSFQEQPLPHCIAPQRPLCERADDGASSGRGGFAVIQAVTDRESEERERGGAGRGRGMAWNGMMVFALHAVISLRDHRPVPPSQGWTGTHKRTYRIRSNVHSRISSTQNSVYSIYFYNFQEKQELGLHEIGLKYQGLQPMSLTVISST